MYLEVKHRSSVEYFREIFSNYIFWIQCVSAGPLTTQVEDKVTTSSNPGSIWQNCKLHWLEEWNGKCFHPSKAELLPTIRQGHFQLDSWRNHIPALYMNDGFWWNHTEIINKPVSGYQIVCTLISITRKTASEKSQKPPNKQNLCFCDEMMADFHLFMLVFVNF